MLFPKRQDFTPTQTGIALGATTRFEMTREFHIEALFLEVNITPTAAMATANADAFQNIVQRVTVQTSDGAQNRNVIDCSGPALLEIAQQWVGRLPRATSAAIGTNPAAGTIQLVYPIFFAHPQISDPIGSVLLLPAPRLNTNPIVTVQFSSQAQMDLNGAPTFAATMSARLRIIRRQVTRPNFPTFNAELVELQQNYAVTGTNQLYELQIPGSYTGIMFRDYTAAATRGFIETAGGSNSLQLLGTVIRRFRCIDVQDENDMSQSLVSGDLE